VPIPVTNIACVAVSQCELRLNRLVKDEVFGSRSEALRYGARLVVREEQLERFYEQAE